MYIHSRKTRNLPHSGWYPQTETWYHERPINVKSWKKVRNLAWLLWFSILPQKFKVQNCRPFWKEKREILFKLGRVHYLDTMWVEDFYEIALCVFAFWAKKLKIQNGCHFCKFFESCHIVLKYPGDRKFRRNRSISNG